METEWFIETMRDDPEGKRGQRNLTIDLAVQITEEEHRTLGEAERVLREAFRGRVGVWPKPRENAAGSPRQPGQATAHGAASAAGQRIEADQANLLVPHQSDQQVANEFCELRCAPFEFFTCRLVPVVQELASKIVEALRPLRVGVV
jgi:hypothetical protein